MMKPTLTIHDVETGEAITREMTDEEYAELLASGWTPATSEPEPETEDGTP
jgi:hypothetical protein